MSHAATTPDRPVGHGLLGLQSEASVRRLSLISDLRNRGVGDHINLPQLVVSGDQSTGKSSVLEAITGLPFPRQDGLCTRFPTEINLEHANELGSNIEVTATIAPHMNQNDETKLRMRNYSRKLQNFAELGSVINEVGELMGLTGYGGHTTGPAFGSDILQIKVCGDTGLNLSIVDLPGIIATPNEDQNDRDVEIVHTLVDMYAANPRAIILAVVQAGNDIANQSIIKKSKKFDKAGERTIGVITKPDLINEGAEGRIAALARNEDTTKLKLGFFILKNPTPVEIAAEVCLEERERNELTYFSSPPWIDKGLDPARTGVVVLRRFLQDALDTHVNKELPKVRQEIKRLLVSTEGNLRSLGEARPGASQMRTFLSRLAMSYHSLTSAALLGDYDASHSGFFSTDNVSSRRLRAFVHMINTEFSNYMRVDGQALKVVENMHEALEDDLDIASLAVDKQDHDQLYITNDKYQAWIKRVSDHSTVNHFFY